MPTQSPFLEWDFIPRRKAAPPCATLTRRFPWSKIPPVPVTYLKPDGIDNLTEHKEGKDPEGAENGGEDELQPGPDIAVQGRVTLGRQDREERVRNWCRNLLVPPYKQERDLPMICAVTD